MRQPRPKALTGARAIIRIDSEIVAFATSVTYLFETDYKEIREIDNSLPVELAPANIKVEVTCGNVRIPNLSPTVLGIQANIYSHLYQCYCTIEIKDRKTDALILYVPKAMMVRREGSIPSRGVATETWVFRGISAWDEKIPKRPTMPT